MTMNSNGRVNPGRLLAVLLAGQFMANVDTAIVNVAAPSIRTGLSASGGELQLVVSGYILTYAMLLVTGARLGQMRGYRRMFMIGLGLFTLASLACGLAPSAPALILARIVQGTGAAMMVPQVLSGIQLNFPGPERARAIGLYAVALSGGAVAGQVLGGLIVSANLFGATWQPVFLINVPIGLVLMAAAARFLPADQQRSAQRLDLAGVATLSIAVLLAIVPLILGRDQSWPGWTWVSLIASVPAVLVFITIERRVAAQGRDPLVNLQLLARPAIAWGLVAFGAAGSTYFSMLFVLALYLQQGLDKTPLYSGLALVSWVAAFGLAGPLLRRLPAARVPLFAPVGSLVLAGSYLGIGLSVMGGTPSGSLLIALLGLGGLGLGLGFSAIVAHITNSVPERYAPDASGLITTISQITAAAGIAIFGTLYLSLVAMPGPGPAMQAFSIVNAAFAVTAFLAAAAAYVSIRRSSTHVPQQAIPATATQRMATSPTEA